MSDLRLQIQAEKIRELEKQRMIDQLQRQLEQAKADAHECKARLADIEVRLLGAAGHFPLAFGPNALGASKIEPFAVGSH